MPVLRRVLLSAAAMLLLGVAAGLVWECLAEPAQWQVRGTGLVMTEAASQDRFSVVVVFVLVGVIASLLWGLFTGVTLRRLGWVVAPLVIVMTSVAAVVAWRLGVAVGPPDPATVTGLAEGDRVPARLAVDGFAAFVVWPIAGLVGFIAATLSDRRPDRDDELG